MRATYSTDLGNRLRALLFERDASGFVRDGSPVLYKIKPGSEVLAAAYGTWAVHGVCLDCQRWTISAGRCAECGRVYRPEGLGAPDSTLNERFVGVQLDLAARLL